MSSHPGFFTPVTDPGKSPPPLADLAVYTDLCFKRKKATFFGLPHVEKHLLEQSASLARNLLRNYQIVEELERAYELACDRFYEWVSVKENTLEDGFTVDEEKEWPEEFEPNIFWRLLKEAQVTNLPIAPATPKPKLEIKFFDLPPFPPAPQIPKAPAPEPLPRHVRAFLTHPESRLPICLILPELWPVLKWPAIAQSHPPVRWVTQADFEIAEKYPNVKNYTFVLANKRECGHYLEADYVLSKN